MFSRSIEDMENFRGYYKFKTPIKFDAFEAVGFFPYSIATTRGNSPILPRTIFAYIEDKINLEARSRIVSNKTVFIFKKTKQDGSGDHDFAIQFFDLQARISKLDDIKSYYGNDLSLLEEGETLNIY